MGILKLRALHEIPTVKKTAVTFIANVKVVIGVCAGKMKKHSAILLHCMEQPTSMLLSFLSHQNRVATGKLLLVMVLSLC